ncbi:hypothetical protein COCON_G00123940 [Conger conger]|uniref:GON domain-containing protein n=1 Tax=Conger conger TaxID=82655 RepID=A0A9Q1HZ21_CONCO|nr:hypothetical protein COCON_G00123940 [Conger conger]
MKQRSVACVDGARGQVEEQRCPLRRPRVLKACRARSCPGWKANRWSQIRCKPHLWLCGRCEICQSAVHVFLFNVTLHCAVFRDVWGGASAEGGVLPAEGGGGSGGGAVQRPIPSPQHSDLSPPRMPTPHTWATDAWQHCNVSCGEGVRSRKVLCVDAASNPAHEARCDPASRPAQFQPCSPLPARGLQCSVTCGAGLQRREVYCRLKGAGAVGEEQCSGQSRPPSTQTCLLPECLRLHTWATDAWQHCNVSCGEGVRSRAVLCVDAASNPAHEARCDPASRPAQFQPCSPAPCQHVWITGDWSQGPPHSDCPKPHPPATRHCQLHPCPPTATWTVGPWSKCSQTCGAGVMERRVECLGPKDLPSKSCRPIDRPQSRAACRQRECELSASCREVQEKEGVRADGEYHLRVKSRLLQIYCAEMQSDFPKEYVTLRSGLTDNYSEVYGFRLQNPFECPFNGSRRQDCACRNDYPAQGYTLFHRVRLDLTSMRIITTDLLFSQTPLGRAGQFSINLTGTGLKVAESVKWVSQGNYVTVKVHRSEDGTRIYGRCGGFCGKCSPQAQSGLLVQVH